MAVRIPQYTEQVRTPGNLVSGAEGSVPRSIRMDLEGFDSFAAGLRRRHEESELNNARAALATEEPRAQLAMAEAFSNIQRAWKPGDKPVADQMFEAVDAYRADAETRITDTKARELLAERANQFKSHYGAEGFAFQQKAEVDNRVSSYETAYADIGSLAATDPAAFGQQIATINAAVMADTQIPEMAKRQFVREQSRTAALAAAKAQAELSPESVMAYTGALLGITEPVITAPASGSIRDEIIRRESGGRMYGEGGKVLRGPAITTQSGETVHAFGPYQLLESTAKQQAHDIGVPWKPEVFFRDQTGDPTLDAETREYHDLLGESYIQAQDALFGGNPVLIAAAHNMGPEATKGWAAGRPYQTQSGKWWYPSKPMDMAAMPEETRKYVQDLGATEATVGSAQSSTPIDVSGEGGTPYRLLDAGELLSVRGIAQSQLAEQRRQASEALGVQRELFKQRVTDLETAAKHGDPIELPTDAELTTFLGPAGAALTKQKLVNYQGMATGLKQMPALSNAELEALSNAPDPQGSADRENRQFVRDTMAEEAQRVLALRKADPGQAALSTSNIVADSYRAWGDAANTFYTADPAATPEQFDAMAAAQANFVRTNFAQQRMWGVTQPKLPKGIVDKMAEGFRVQMERDPQQAAQYIGQLPALMGSDDAVSEIANKIGPLAWLAMDGVSGMTLKRIQAANATPEAERMKLMPAGTRKSDIDEAVRDAFDPLLATLAYQNDTVTANRYRQAGMTLAMDRMSTGASATEAARAAYAELFGDRSVVNGTYRVDTTQHDPAAVDRGLSLFKTTLDPARLLVQPEPGFTLAESQERKARTVRQAAYWVNNAAGTGVYLMHPAGPVLDVNGKPIEVMFDAAAAAKMPETPKTTWHMGYGAARGL